MAAVVGVRIGVAKVDFIELTHGLGPGVAQPACGASGFLFQQEFCAIGPTATDRYLFLPVLEAEQEGGPVFVFDQVLHVLVVAFQGELPAFAQIVGIADSRLPGFLRPNVLRHWHPEVGGQANRLVRQQVHVLHHLDIAPFERALFTQQVPGRKAGLQTLVIHLIHLESVKMHSQIHPKTIPNLPVVLEEGHVVVGHFREGAKIGVQGVAPR